MRILNVKWILAALVGAAVLSGCEKKPVTVALPMNIDIAKKKEKKKDKSVTAMPPALWFTTSNTSNSGFLGRLDLKTGVVNRQVLQVEADTQISQDGADGLLLLARGFLDSVRVLRGTDARVAGYKSLQPPRANVHANAQGAARDSKGRVWVTTMESNLVLVFSPDLSEQVGSVDLSGLKESNEADAVADLAQIAQLDDRHMVVTAQRLRRHRDGMPPAEQSGLAVIDSETLKPVSSGLVNLPNPIQMAVHNGKVTIVGAGDLSQDNGATGRIAAFSGGALVMEKPEEFSAKIINADLSMAGEPPALVAWYPKENKSCVQLGQKQLVCSGGFVFYAIKRAGDSIFASFRDASHAELWVVDTDGEGGVQKLPMNMPIQSLSFGP